MNTIAIFSNHPECSDDCIEGMRQALVGSYTIKTFTVDECDASSYDQFFRRKAQNVVADFVANGGRYLGICMGAYWAGSHYFDILDRLDAVQYIKQPHADIKRSYGTVAKVLWEGQPENIFFYDGCAIIGDLSRCEVVATYSQGDAAAIIQGRVGIIGPHLESQEYWFEAPRMYINQYWHGGSHHKLLLNFVDKLMSTS